jgi:zinc protease
VDVPQTVILFGGPGIARNDPDFMAAYVVNHILGGGTLSTSRLYKEVREKRGLVYSVSESLIWMKKSTAVRRLHRDPRRQARRKRSTPSPASCAHGQEGPTQKPNWTRPSRISRGRRCWRSTPRRNSPPRCCSTRLDKLGIDYIERRNGIIDAVTLDDAKRVARRLWGQNFLTVAVGRIATPAGASN